MKNLSLYNQDLSVPRKKDVDTKQDKITVNGIVQGDGNGNLSAAQTVNGETIELNAAAVGLGNVDNTSDDNKPISTATQEALNGKQDKITASGILKGDGAGGVSAAKANTDYATCTNLRNGTGENSALLNPGESVASGTSSFACGTLTTASGFAALAEGVQTEASGSSSHTEGYGTKANHNSQHVEGQYNIEDDSTNPAIQKGNYVHIVGNGTRDSERSNAHTLDWAGNAWFAGDVYVGSTSGTNKDDGSKKLITADEVPKGAVYTATLTAAGWVISGAWKTQTVSVTGLKTSYNAAPFVDVALSGTDAAADAELAAAWLGISASAIANTAANSLTVKFPATVDTPTVNIPIRVTTYD